MLKHAMLGLLAEREGHGWELQHRFETLLAQSWPLNNGQVYATLQRMERNELISSRVEPQDDRPDRHVYTITDKGRHELKRWLTEPPPADGLLKDEFFLKVLIRALNGDTHMTDMLHQQRQHYYDALAALSARRLDSDVPIPTQLLIDGATRRLEADLQWLDDVEARLGDLHSGN